MALGCGHRDWTNSSLHGSWRNSIQLHNSSLIEILRYHVRRDWFNPYARPYHEWIHLTYGTRLRAWGLNQSLLTRFEADPAGRYNSSQCWWAGMYPRANQSPRSISLTTKKCSAQGMVPPYLGRKCTSRKSTNSIVQPVVAAWQFLFLFKMAFLYTFIHLFGGRQLTFQVFPNLAISSFSRFKLFCNFCLVSPTVDRHKPISVFAWIWNQICLFTFHIWFQNFSRHSAFSIYLSCGQRKPIFEFFYTSTCQVQFYVHSRCHLIVRFHVLVFAASGFLIFCQCWFFAFLPHI